MPIHSRVIGQVISKGTRFIQSETKFWRGLYGPSGRYPGVSNYKQAVKGLQHGLAAGGAAGSVIKDREGPEMDGPLPWNGSTPSAQDKARGGRRRQRRRYTQRRCKPYKHSRRSSFSFR